MKVQRVGESWRYRFIVESDEPINEDEAVRIQKSYGYNPDGYGFGGFKTEEIENGCHRSTWTCSTLAD